ncbi:protein boule-like [Homarus americanus]|uniref:protein boule-like n=1 Tax=Homarus americanus TaxID=6706 RepID=UPI001C493227|nr:protein boule-like [Homarus americanus]
MGLSRPRRSSVTGQEFLRAMVLSPLRQKRIARRITQEADNIMLKDRKLNIAPAIKKQVSDVGYMKTYSPHLIEGNNSVVGTGGTMFFGNGTSYATYGNQVPVMAPTEYHPTFPQAPAAPTTASAYPTIMYPQHLYYPQQYQYQPTQTVQPQWGAAPQWRWYTPVSYSQQPAGSYISSDGMYTQASPTYIVPDRTY